MNWEGVQAKYDFSARKVTRKHALDYYSEE